MRMAQHRYPPSAMVSDCLVSGGGLALTLPPLAMFDLPSVTVWILGLLSLGFALYGLGVVRRHRIRIETDEEGLRFSPPRRRIAWDEITRFGLSLLLHPPRRRPRLDGAQGREPRRDALRGLEAGTVRRAGRPRVAAPRRAAGWSPI